uniref:Uncharacterized protein n=1 Tax=Candidatus Kentrum sp. FM TaxID=2126340 RepID=A0A450RZF6_9GAMM|nr:MAG: hypothetical protein BECKFM1743A_GA0114220_100192 [Candidatus Kentron sp. FM]
MTDLYAWNTARAGSIAHPNVVGRAYSTLQGRADFLVCSTNLSPNKKMRPLNSSLLGLESSKILPRTSAFPRYESLSPTDS